jgi:hypothetical protein
MCRYRSWVEEEENNVSPNYQNISFDELEPRISYATMYKYYKIWSANSF